MAVTWRPQDLRSVPTLLAIMPLPIPDITPPVTKMYFIFGKEIWTERKELLLQASSVYKKMKQLVQDNILKTLYFIYVYVSKYGGSSKTFCSLEKNNNQKINKYINKKKKNYIPK